MLELAKEIIEITGSKSEIRFEPLPSDDPKDRCPDISKAKSILGWEPLISRTDGMKKTIQAL
jgi:dTDP-glucose 4,6-dehydratase